MDARAKLATLILMSALLDGIEAGGDMGAPEGILYASVMAAGCTLPVFQQARDSLVRLGLAESRPGPCLAITASGRQMAADLNRALGANRARAEG